MDVSWNIVRRKRYAAAGFVSLATLKHADGIAIERRGFAVGSMCVPDAVALLTIATVLTLQYQLARGRTIDWLRQ